jgi:DNA-binding transcriptional regulator LsrR (DeoR family)
MKTSADATPTAAGRPTEEPDTAQMQEVARLFYDNDLTRQAIARRLRIDTRKVSWLLKQARERGIVKIIIPQTVDDELASQLLKKFPHLEDVMIVPDAPYQEGFRRRAVVAADYFERLVKTHPRGQPLRVALTGRSASPPLFDVMAVLGRERSLSRLGLAVDRAAGRH